MKKIYQIAIAMLIALPVFAQENMGESVPADGAISAPAPEHKAHKSSHKKAAKKHAKASHKAEGKKKKHKKNKKHHN